MGDSNQPERRSGDASGYGGPERRQDYLQWRAKVNQRLDEGAATMRELRADIADNTETTRKIQTDTNELVELLRSFKGAFKVLEMLGKLAKPLGYIVALVGGLLGLVALVKGGGTPR